MLSAPFGLNNRHLFEYDESAKEGILQLYSYSYDNSGLIFGGTEFVNVTLSIGKASDIIEVLKDLFTLGMG